MSGLTRLEPREPPMPTSALPVTPPSIELPRRADGCCSMPAGAGGRRHGERADGRDTKRQGGGLIAALVELQQATAGELDFAHLARARASARGRNAAAATSAPPRSMRWSQRRSTSWARSSGRRQIERRAGCFPTSTRCTLCIHENARKWPMTWTTPTLVEICIGLEINGYLPAEF